MAVENLGEKHQQNLNNFFSDESSEKFMVFLTVGASEGRKMLHRSAAERLQNDEVFW